MFTKTVLPRHYYKLGIWRNLLKNQIIQTVYFIAAAQRTWDFLRDTQNLVVKKTRKTPVLYPYHKNLEDYSPVVFSVFFRNRTLPHPPPPNTVEVWHPNHWTTREVFLFNIQELFFPKEIVNVLLSYLFDFLIFFPKPTFIM